MPPKPLIAKASPPLKGSVEAPPDKSISHRALILAGLAAGESRIRNLLTSDDVLRTAAALRALGVSIERDGQEWRVGGRRWRSPDRPLYFGNSGTGCRLMLGACAGQGVAAQFDGDGSLRSRPMGRVAEPLSRMGADIETCEGKLPARLHASRLRGVDYALPAPSAQVKSAILLAGLGASGETIVRENVRSRDHTERMLPLFGAGVLHVGGEVRINGPCTLKPCDVEIPGDPSSAAFIAAAALIVPGSDVLIRNVMMNPLRSAFYDVVREMGGKIEIIDRRAAGGDAVADLRVRHSKLAGVTVGAYRAASMIDEYPILSVLAAFAFGDTRMDGLSELRIKESDRLAAIEAGLKANGVTTEAGPDWLVVRGDGAPEGGAAVATNADHRIAMSFLVMGLASRRPVSVDDHSMIATSFPGFASLFSSLRATIEPA